MTKIFNRYNGKDRRKELRSNLTKGEVILWQHIKGKQLGGFKFRRQQGIIVKRYTSDDIFNNLDQTLEDLYQTCYQLRERRSIGKPPSDPSSVRRG